MTANLYSTDRAWPVWAVEQIIFCQCINNVKGLVKLCKLMKLFSWIFMNIFCWLLLMHMAIAATENLMALELTFLIL